jgi:hypothetical protein
VRARAAVIAAAFSLWAADANASSAAVTPSGDTVPENLLRIELHLRHPLPRPLAMDRVRLVDARGALIAGALLDLPLPGDDGRTITLLLDPARVKTGVGANRAMGRALRAGQDIELRVDDPQLPAPLRKRWQVREAIQRALVPAQWRFAPPPTASREPLVVMLDAPLTASSAPLIAVRGPDGERVAGAVSLQAGETTWIFRPARPWVAGRHALVAHPRLEDVSGNRPCAPFEARGLADADCPSAEQAFDVR